MEQLRDEQLKAFDKEYVNDARWTPVARCIDRDFPDGRFTFLDIGGGNGLFADRILARYPASCGVVLDNSSLLLGRNRRSERKDLILASAEKLAELHLGQFDIIFFNWVLHHLVARRRYRASRRNIETVLRTARSLLTERGRVSIYENVYDGWLFDGLPSWLIYRATSSAALAAVARRAGANTAGVGVCFLSYKQWCAVLSRSGFHVLRHTPEKPWDISWPRQLLLHIRCVHCSHFWLAPSAAVCVAKGSDRARGTGRAAA